MGSKKKSHNGPPLSKAAAIAEAHNKAIVLVQAMSLTVLADKFGFTQEELARYWEGLNYLSDSVAKGRVAVGELLKTLDEEYDIILTR